MIDFSKQCTLKRNISLKSSCSELATYFFSIDFRVPFLVCILTQFKKKIKYHSNIDYVLTHILHSPLCQESGFLHHCYLLHSS